MTISSAGNNVVRFSCIAVHVLLKCPIFSGDNVTHCYHQWLSQYMQRTTGISDYWNRRWLTYAWRIRFIFFLVFAFKKKSLAEIIYLVYVCVCEPYFYHLHYFNVTIYCLYKNNHFYTKDKWSHILNYEALCLDE